MTALPPLPSPGVPFAFPPEAMESLAALTPAVRRAGRTLLLADEPERVHGPGLMYRDTVSGPFRAYLYALIDVPAAIGFEVRVRNPGTMPVTVRVERAGVGGPGAGFFQVGQAALAAWLAEQAPLRPFAVPPGRTLPLWPPLRHKRAVRGQALNAIVDATASGPLEVSLVADGGGRAEPEPLPPGPRPAALPMRGSFAAADLTLAVACAPGQRLRLGLPPSYLVGYSALDELAVINYGNYGVRYDIALSAQGPAAEATLVFVPGGGGFCGAVAMGRRLLPLAAPGGRQLDVRQAVSLGRHRLPAAGAPPLTLTWMAPAASYLPAVLALG